MDYNRWRFPFMHNGRFANYPGENLNRAFWKSIRGYLTLLFAKQKYNPEELAQWIASSREASLEPALTSNTPHIMWIGHSTFLIRIGGITILTDPIFDTLHYILSFKRLVPPGIPLKSLPKIDVVLISHNHPDHMDKTTLLFLQKRDNPLILVPYGDKKWFERREFEHVKEFMWWDQTRVGDVNLTFLPSVHWSQRSLLDHNKSLWGAWMIEEIKGSMARVFFAGDTAYGSHFKALADTYTRVDLALMPVGPTEPQDLQACHHLDAEGAGRAFVDINADYLVPMHWGTYRLGTEAPLQPIRQLTRWWKEHAHMLKEKNLLYLKIGQIMGITPQLRNTAFAQTTQLIQSL